MAGLVARERSVEIVLGVDDVHGSLFGRCGTAVDADVTGIHVVFEGVIAILARRHEPAAAAPSRLADEVLFGKDRVGVVAADPLEAAGALAGLVVGSAVCRVGVRCSIVSCLLCS